MSETVTRQGSCSEKGRVPDCPARGGSYPGPWTDWSDCMAHSDCGKGVKVRERMCLSSGYAKPDCKGDNLREKKTCNTYCSKSTNKAFSRDCMQRLTLLSIQAVGASGAPGARVP